MPGAITNVLFNIILKGFACIRCFSNELMPAGITVPAIGSLDLIIAGAKLTYSI